MSSTFLSLHYHIVFSTKYRLPQISESIQRPLHEYLGGVIHGLDAFPQGVGGVADHVHLLVGLNSTHRLSDFLRELKKASSSWMRSDERVPEFEWQEGYAAFTVSATSRDGVKRYVANQAEHHRKKSFREELVELLKKAGIEYDERYLD